MALDFTTLDIPTLGLLLHQGEASSESLVEHSLCRIEALNPLLNAIVCVNPQALSIARECDQQRKLGKPTGALHGLPIVIKDNIDTGDRMPTTAGSIALANSVRKKDAFVVEQLRNAGAVIVAKANLSEWANFRSPFSSTGWSSVGGQTRNSFDPTRSPGGSSSGSAVAVAAGLCVAAVGTETDGSVVIPSAMNSLVGIKPSLGRVSRTGIIPIAHSQDTAGPMARTLADAYCLLQCMVGGDNKDAITLTSPPLGKLAKISAATLQGKRLGLVTDYCEHHPRVLSVLDEVITLLRDTGVTVVEDIRLFDTQAVDEMDTTLMLYEFKHDLNKYLSTVDDIHGVSNIEALIAFNEQNAEQAMPYFGQEWLLAACEMDGLESPAYKRLLAEVKRSTGRDGIDAALERDRLDALIAPTIGTPWKIDLVNGDHRSVCAATPAALSGYPSVTVPAGFAEGLPVGLLFFGAAFADTELAELAGAFEKLHPVGRAPDIDAISMNA